MTNEQLIVVILSIILPPIGAIMAKASGVQIFLNILLTIFGFWILGILHAIYLVMNSKNLGNQ